MRISEASKESCNRLRGASYGDLAGFPNDGIQIEVRQALPRSEGSSIGALSRPRVAEDEDFHAAQRERYKPR
jgi:hypothetical protein